MADLREMGRSKPPMRKMKRKVKKPVVAPQPTPIKVGIGATMDGNASDTVT